ncbi:MULTISPECIES: helix-turn-helix domain-containing protein [Aestuariimicrobium]|uniref:helix-turn-helix domain-containing protein n=1 Tax=Aestuariimicrobium TaxID=396388 RepID=UPI00041A7822|nr:MULTISPECIES: helix-turn-helix transcriptional regulator [Aestuariimicrobium]CAI9408435.1 Transcriptional regulator ClgR [Aestuariimicrobium sp. T2.26MG-19.2B]
MKPMLMRELIGETLRELRFGQGRTLRDVSMDARVSLGYLSEVERGQKEASSELLASIATALNVPLSQVLHTVSQKLVTTEQPQRPVVVKAA